MKVRKLYATAEDATMLRNAPPSEPRRVNEDFVRDCYLNDYIAKPWGHEYRIYIDVLYDVWKLMLAPGHATSTHCHPRKDTVLLCLAGQALLRSVGAEHTLERGDTVHIKKGVFHSTANVGGGELDLVEIEIPRNKFDLVRIGDHYGRASSRYEAEALDVSALPPLLPVEEGKPAFLRQTDLQGKYRFSLNSYASVVDSADVICHINVDLEPFLQDRISIVRTREHMAHSEKEQGSFLTISGLPPRPHQL